MLHFQFRFRTRSRMRSLLRRDLRRPEPMRLTKRFGMTPQVFARPPLTSISPRSQPWGLPREVLEMPCKCPLEQSPQALAYDEAWRDARQAMYAVLDADRDGLSDAIKRELAERYQGLRAVEIAKLDDWRKLLDEHRFCNKRTRKQGDAA